MPNLILYHATGKMNWQKIIDQGLKVPATDWARFYVGRMRKKPGSLGFGTYGFLSDKELAEQYWLSTTSGQEHVIIRIEIDVNEDNCLNFVNGLKDMRLFKNFIMENRIQPQITNLNRLYHNSYRQHEFDGALIEYYIRRLEKTDVFQHIACVTCATTTDLYHIKTYIPNGIEYCIRNVRIVQHMEGV